MKAACCTFWPIPRKERKRTRHSSGACPSMKLVKSIVNQGDDDDGGDDDDDDSDNDDGDD